MFDGHVEWRGTFLATQGERAEWPVSLHTQHLILDMSLTWAGEYWPCAPGTSRAAGGGCPLGMLRQRVMHPAPEGDAAHAVYDCEN